MKPALALALAPALLLAACGSGSQIAPPPAPVTSLSGTLSAGGASLDKDFKPVLTSAPWTEGAGTMTLSVDQGGSAAAVALATTPLNADGTFSFASLPAPAPGTLGEIGPGNDNPAFCNTTSSLSDPAARGTALMLSAKTAQGVSGFQQQDIDSPARIVKLSTLFYSDRNVKFEATQTCTQTSGTSSNVSQVSYNVQLSQGWNSLVSTIQLTVTGTEATGLTVTTKVTGQQGTLGSARWYSTSLVPTPLSLRRSPSPALH